MNDLITSWGVPLVGLALTIVLSVTSAKRAAYDRAIGALEFLSEGEPAKARHRVGSLVFRFKREILDGTEFVMDEQEINDRIEDIFTILWATRRLNAVRHSLVPRRVLGLSTSSRLRPMWGFEGPHNLLRDSAGDWISYWTRTVRGRPGLTLIDAVTRGLGATLDLSDKSPITELAAAWPDPASKPWPVPEEQP